MLLVAPVPLHRGLPGDGFLRFGDLLVDSLQGSAGPVGAVLVEDHPFAWIGFGAHQPGLGKDLPVADWLTRVGAAPFGDLVGDVGDPGADDELQPGILDCGQVRLG